MTRCVPEIRQPECMCGDVHYTVAAYIACQMICCCHCRIQAASRVQLVLDMSLDKYMLECPKDMVKLAKQIERCYGANRRAAHPLQLHLTSLGPNLPLPESKENQTESQAEQQQRQLQLSWAKPRSEEEKRRNGSMD